MGLYDTIIVKCPNCGTEHEFQSKSGECILGEYDLKNCPEDVLANVNRHSPRECDCGISFEVDIEKRKAKTSTAEYKNITKKYPLMIKQEHLIFKVNPV